MGHSVFVNIIYAENIISLLVPNLWIYLEIPKVSLNLDQFSSAFTSS